MRRREFIGLLGAAAAAWPPAARAQQGQRRVGVLMNSVATDAYRQAQIGALTQRLQQLGWADGRNVRVEVRWNAGDAELARIYGAQLIGLMPDVIVVSTSTNLTVIQQATTTIPVVFLSVSDPVAQGFVASMTRPGGNITGFAQNEFSVGGKWLGLLRDVAPSLARIAVMFNPETSPQSKFFVPAIEAAAASLGLQSVVLEVRATADIAPAVEGFARVPNGGLILPTDTFVSLRGELVAELAAHHHLPIISGNAQAAKQGMLMQYTVSEENALDQWRQAAAYVDRILKGASPRDLPVQSADKYSLTINLKTAKAFGLTVPSGVLSIADEVVE